MRSRRSLNNFLSKDRKTLYVILSILLVSAFTLTVVYAALSTTLNISGNVQVTAASWDIYLDNVQLNSNSATTAVPTISDKTTASFSTTLTNPGDFYEFTVDVVNNGSIDAMVDSVTKTPTLTETQAKYLNYIVEYQNGESITTKQLVSKNSYVRLKVKVEFRKDISVSDLPTKSETLNLSFTVNYTQADDGGIGVVDNVCTSSSSCTLIENPSGIQDSTALGAKLDEEYVPTDFPWYGTTSFSSTNYWSSMVSSYPAYVYNSNSTLYNYVDNYRAYLESQGAEIEEARLIKVEELENLGCSMDNNHDCSEAPEWVYGTSYWSGSAYSSSFFWMVISTGSLGYDSFSDDDDYGIRPVIVVKS